MQHACEPTRKVAGVRESQGMLRAVLKRLPTPLALCFGAMLCPTLAFGQTITLADATKPILLEADGTPVTTRPATVGNNVFSYEDCVKDRRLSYQANVVNPDTSGGTPLQVWVSQGSDCKVVTNRNGATQQCWMGRRQGIIGSSNETIAIRLQDVVHQNRDIDRTDAYVPGTANDCVNLPSLPFGIEFLFIQGTQSVGTGAAASITVDTVGPAPPTQLGLGAGDGLIVVRWNVPIGSSEISRYAVYCDDGSLPPLDEDDAQTDAGVSADAGTEDPSDAGTDDADDASAAQGVRPLLNASSSSSSGSTSIDPGTRTACPATALRAGTLPSPRWAPCAEVTGSTASEVTITQLGTGKNAPPLVNDQPYAFAVSAYDALGNPGPLSEVVCNTPVTTIDFFEAYRAAGGQAGCSSSGTASALGPATGIGAIFLALVRARRRRSTNRPSA